MKNPKERAIHTLVRKAGIKDIADALGVSIGTVDRALHARPGVNPDTSDRVLRMADKLGYRPNIAARALKLNRRLRIAVQLPKEISSFFAPLREGIRSGIAGSYGTGLEVHFAEYPRLGSGDMHLLEAALAEKYDGILCTPSDVSKAGPLIDKLQRSGTAVVCVGSDAPRSERLASIAIDGYVSGKGLKAAMTVSTIVGALRNETSRQPAQVLANLNRVLHGQVSGFVTCCATLITSDGEMTLANAGNPAPYRNGAEMAVAGGLPLGIVAEGSCEEMQYQLAPGDRLTFLSDGVVEATNEKRELFGFERTQQISNQAAAAIANTAKAFGQQDDITVVTVTRAANLEAALA